MPSATAKVCALTAGLLIAGDVRAGDVKGSVRATEEVKLKSVEGVRAPYWQEWNGFIDPKKGSFDYAREVSAVLIGPQPTKDAVTVVLKNGTLTPSTIVAQIGTTLRIRNEDDFGHELVVDALKGFDAVETSPGATRSILLEQTGAFVVRDRLAPYVHGHLHVIAKLTQVVNPSADGSFAFREVPAGNYTLKVFRGAKEVSTAEVEVGGKETELDTIPLPPAAADGKGK
ncbi:MAG TPA: cupredoxin domain-containing protein [Polyangiales bacterium]